MLGLYLLGAVIILLIIYGIYNILLFFFNVASKKSYKVASKIIGLNHSNQKIEIFFDRLALRLSKIVVIDELKYAQMKDILRYNNEAKDPKVFIAENIIKSLVLALFGLIFVFIFPIFSGILIVFSVILYFIRENNLYMNYIKQKREIENELPRFCQIIKQEIKVSNDVIGILGRYAQNTNKALSKEIKTTIADMNSSSYEAALQRFEARLSIDRLGEIVRGLIGVLRGDNMQTHFELLSSDLEELELQRLNDIAVRQSRKVSKYQLIVLIVMIVNYLIIMGMYLLTLEKPF